MTCVRLAGVIVLAMLTAIQAAEPELYLFDYLRHPPYRAAFTQLLKNQATPDWVKAFLQEGDGVVSPMKKIEISGQPYRLDHLCKPHDCSGNAMVVLWAPGGRHVWAGLVENGGAPVLFGKTTPDQVQALTAALKGS